MVALNDMKQENENTEFGAPSMYEVTKIMYNGKQVPEYDPYTGERNPYTISTSINKDYKKYKTPQDQSVGYFVFSEDMKIPMLTKPNRIHRFFTRLLLGWKWQDK